MVLAMAAEVLEQRRLARLRGGDDEPALAAADRRDQVDHAQGDLGAVAREHEGLVGIHRDQVLEVRKSFRLFRREPDRLRHFNEYAAPASTVTSQAFHLRAIPQAEVPCD
jgi:hypothetical protein